MKPANFPARKLARQQRALNRFKPADPTIASDRFHAKELELDTLVTAVSKGAGARDIRSKKVRV